MAFCSASSFTIMENAGLRGRPAAVAAASSFSIEGKDRRQGLGDVGSVSVALSAPEQPVLTQRTSQLDNLILATIMMMTEMGQIGESKHIIESFRRLFTTDGLSRFKQALPLRVPPPATRVSDKRKRRSAGRQACYMACRRSITSWTATERQHAAEDGIILTSEGFDIDWLAREFARSKCGVTGASVFSVP
ncbi:hypothetical protein TEQG_02493 [Trichophyton equinum CBS 127.97]|uniref:Uncharacterized protein n=1 Tax=Trichophyton equinum (strain ATCC MYA-4606 / CBS 127.97) TaxID=559882 RepID=F2PNJ4_TRIEC|nr:hypothetical protein TEQG_02493 [Trichophyton equinum CBS 127.97]